MLQNNSSNLKYWSR